LARQNYIYCNDISLHILKGGDNVSDVGDKVIGVSMGLLVAAILLPMALTELAGASLTSVDPAVATVVTVLLPVLAVIGIAYAFYRM
jgi:hypothetical protein